MSILVPEIDDDALNASLNLQERIDAVLIVGLVCHCTEITNTAGQEHKFGKDLIYTDDTSRRRVVGRWTLSIRPEQAIIVMSRLSGSANDVKLTNVTFNNTDTNVELAEKSLVALDELRRSNGVIASDGDVEELRQVIIARLGA